MSKDKLAKSRAKYIAGQFRLHFMPKPAELTREERRLELLKRGIKSLLPEEVDYER